MKSIVYAAREVKKHLRQQTGVSFANYEIMAALDAADGACWMGELTARIQRAVSTLTGLVDCAERDGFVVRERSKQDRRVVMIRLVNPGALARAEAFMASVPVPETVTDCFVEIVQTLHRRSVLAIL